MCYGDVLWSKSCIWLRVSWHISRLVWYGIRGVVAKCFETYLKGTTQFVSTRHHSNNSINFVRLSNLNVERGVSQDSVLDPVLFLIFINDVTEFMSDCNFLMQAGDTSTVVSSRNMLETVNKVNTIINNMDSCFLRNKLCLNQNKINYLIFQDAHSNQ